jgi:hypothetical protein
MLKLTSSAGVLLLALLSTWAQNDASPYVFSRPTFVSHSCEAVPKFQAKVFEDKDYVFAFRGYGKANSVPGFFVQRVKDSKWLEIRKLSTENAKLGHSPSMEKVPKEASWEYSGLSKSYYADLPLQTSESINFPDRIVPDQLNQAYRFDFNSGLNLDEALTSFWVTKKDLEDAFDEPTD